MPDSQKMPAYIGTKIISAWPMTNTDFQIKRKSEVMPGQTTDGYLVVYPDGYESWSPKETFEAAYRLISPEERKLVL